jgi:type I restriction enzyme, S subunit
VSNKATGLPRYESYKDSGVAWLGEVPSHWDVKPIRAITKLKSDRNRPDLPVLSVYREYGVILKDSRDDNNNETSLDTRNYKVVLPGDLVVNKMKAWQGSMGISAYEGIVSPAYITCSTKSEMAESRFLHYLLRSSKLIEIYYSLSYGVRIGQWDMHYEDFKQIVIPIPPYDEQARIVACLDQKTAEIDAAIAQKERLIELLQEQKSILINQAVTRGLNPNVPMKDSGVEWIGEIPANWRAYRLKFLFSGLTQGWSPQCFNFEAKPGTWGVLKVGCVNHAVFNEHENKQLPPELKPMPEFQIKKGDILISRANSLELVGSAAYVSSVEGKILLCDKLYRVSPQEDKVLPGYFILLFRSQIARSWIENRANGTSPSMQNIGQNVIEDMWVSVPPLTEQQQILNAINDYEERQNALQDETLIQIKILKEFKMALISSAVTGKIKL